jgi:TPR repeat protein
MIVIEIDAQLWTILSGIGGLAGVFALLITIVTIAKSRQKKREELELSCNELCAAISNSKIHTLLNNIIAICDNGTDTKSIIEVQKELNKIYEEASAKWDVLKSKLTAKKHKELLREVEAIFHDYQSCAKDTETIVNVLGLGNVEEVKHFLSNNNSQEIRDIVHTTSKLYEDDLKGFIKQIISLRFKDLDIPDYAYQIRGLMKENYQDKNMLETQLLARMGNARAQNALGDFYKKQNQFEKAFSWYLKSAKQGLPEAQFSLGVSYFNGKGVEEDKREAVEWYKKSAGQGVAEAQYNLGICYEFGEGVKKDEREAVEWYKKSADQGFAEAQYNLGGCYFDGKGVKKDERVAVRWYKKSAEQGLSEAQYNVGICYFDGKGVMKDEREAVEWYKKSAEQGNAMAQYNLGACYEYGEGVEKDGREAVKWYKKSAVQGNAKAQNNMAFCYENGVGVEKDEKKAFEWYKKSAEQGHAKAQRNLGLCYYNGIGCDQNYDKAYFWFSKACEDKENIETYSKAIHCIGAMYMAGTIGFGSPSVAVDYFTIAAQNGYSLAQYALGECYEKGLGVKEVDIEKAKYWYEEAAKQGDADAIESLKRLEKSE